MKCSQCRENFTDLQAGKLSAEVENDVQEHLGACPSCNSALSKIQNLFALLDTYEEVPAHSQSHFLFRLQQETTIQTPAISRTGFSQIFMQLWPSRPLWATTYSLSLLLSGVLGGQLLSASHAEIPSSTSSSTALICPVQSSAAQWMPKQQLNSLT